MLLRSGSLGAARYAVTDRHGGVSAGPYAGLNLGDHVGDAPGAVEENRRRLLAALPGAARLAFMRQVHGRAVATAGPGASGPPTADAIVSSSPGTAVVVLSADCVPVLLAGRTRPVVAAAHAGRLGVQHGVVVATVEALAQQGIAPDELVALVGPAVCGACYEVPDGMRAEVAATVPEAAASTRDGRPALDLPAAVQAQLAGAGVRQVERVEACTLESPDLYSHRRDDPTGRLATVAWVPAVPSPPSAPDTP